MKTNNHLKNEKVLNGTSWIQNSILFKCNSGQAGSCRLFKEFSVSICPFLNRVNSNISLVNLGNTKFRTPLNVHALHCNSICNTAIARPTGPSNKICQPAKIGRRNAAYNHNKAKNKIR